MLLSLHTIASYPPDLANPVFERYSAMKYGERRAVRHYARRLAPMAAALIREAPRREWILTSPPVRDLPSGANLVCEALHAELRRAMPEIGIALETLRLVDDVGAYQSNEDFEAYGDYAKLDLETRRASQIGSDDEVAFERARFAGREVIFVNDINVTGAQMQRIRALIEVARPAEIHWLLIANTLVDVGRRFPQLESDINHSRLSRREEVISLLRGAELRHTGKLVARVLSFGTVGLARIFQSLDTATRRALRRAIEADALYASDFFREKVAMAERAC